jgi:hypothetical protein
LLGYSALSLRLTSRRGIDSTGLPAERFGRIFGCPLTVEGRGRRQARLVTIRATVQDPEIPAGVDPGSPRSRPPGCTARPSSPGTTSSRHTGLGLHTPADVHCGRADTVRAERAAVLTTAYAAHPDRFVRQPPPTTEDPRRLVDQPARTEGGRRTLITARRCLIQIDWFRSAGWTVPADSAATLRPTAISRRARFIGDIASHRPATGASPAGHRAGARLRSGCLGRTDWPCPGSPCCARYLGRTGTCRRSRFRYWPGGCHRIHRRPPHARHVPLARHS